jgi:hypothetical protein
VVSTFSTLWCRVQDSGEPMCPCAVQCGKVRIHAGFRATQILRVRPFAVPLRSVCDKIVTTFLATEGSEEPHLLAVRLMVHRIEVYGRALTSIAAKHERDPVLRVAYPLLPTSAGKTPLASRLIDEFDSRLERI